MTCRHITERMLSDVKRRYDRLISCGEPGFFPAETRGRTTLNDVWKFISWEPDA
jgi:hypothetical protein